MKYIWAILCERVHTDEATKTISLINCIEDIKVNIKPKEAETFDGKKVIQTNLDYSLVSYWLLDENKKGENYKLRLEIIDPNKKVLSFSENSLNVPDGYLRFRSVLAFKNIPFSCPGTYYIKIKISQFDTNYKEVGEIPINMFY